MKKILVISDTHGLNEARVREVINLEHPDLKVHCGDYQFDHKVMDELFDYYVNGNNDFPFDDKHEQITFELEGINFLVMHGHQYSRRDRFGWERNLHHHLKNSGCDVLLYGHSHRYNVKTWKDNLILANPGSLALPANSDPTYMVIEVNNHQIEFFKKTCKPC